MSLRSLTLLRTCPTNYTCLPDAGPNPDFGYTNFDHMGWSLVMSFQLLTMDFWENIYNKVCSVLRKILIDFALVFMKIFIISASFLAFGAKDLVGNGV